jgi:hypothetical protein
MESGKTDLNCYGMNPTLFAICYFQLLNCSPARHTWFYDIGLRIYSNRGPDHVDEGVKVSVIRHGKE